MRRVIGLVVVAAAILAVAWYVAHLQGDVRVAIGGYTIQTTAPVAVLGLAVLILVVHLLLRLIALLISLPARMRRRAARQRRDAGDTSVSRALVAIAAGDSGGARQQTGRARRLLGETPQTLLLSAEAARLAGDEDSAAVHYRKLVDRQDAAFLGLRGLFRQAVAREDWDEATRLARRAEEVHPGAAWLREERAQLAVRTGNWQQALLLSGSDAPIAAYATAAAETEADPYEGLRMARQAYRNYPGFVPAALVYVRRLLDSGRPSRAQDVLKAAWAASPHPELAELALRPQTDPLARVKAATRFVAGRADDPESHFLLARVNLAAGLRGEARRHAEAARARGMDQRRLWLLVADIEGEERGDTEAGRIAQRDALRRAAEADADPAWRCETCGTVHPRWSPACPVCHTAGRINWGTPRVVSAIAGEVMPPPARVGSIDAESRHSETRAVEASEAVQPSLPPAPPSSPPTVQSRPVTVSATSVIPSATQAAAPVNGSPGKPKDTRPPQAIAAPTVSPATPGAAATTATSPGSPQSSGAPQPGLAPPTTPPSPIPPSPAPTKPKAA